MFFLNNLTILMFLLISISNLFIKKQKFNWNIILTYFKYFLGFLYPYLFEVKDINAKKVYTRGTCDKDTYIRNIIAYIGNIYIRGIYSKGIYT